MNAVQWIKTHPIVLAIAGAATAGFVLYSYLHRGSSSVGTGVSAGDTSGLVGAPQYLVPAVNQMQPSSNPTYTSPSSTTPASVVPAVLPAFQSLQTPWMPIPPATKEPSLVTLPPDVQPSSPILSAVATGAAVVPAAVGQVPTLSGTITSPGAMMDMATPGVAPPGTPTTLYASGIGYNIGGAIVGPAGDFTQVTAPAGMTVENGLLVTEDAEGL